MECETVQTWLLRADTLHPEGWPTDLADHVQGCPACARLAREVRQLEDDWRQLPLPAEADDAKATFLRQLPQMRATIKPPVNRFRRTARWVAAAMILTLVSPFVWTLVNPAGVTASSDIVDKLIELNAELASADPAERPRLLAEREAGLRDRLQNARLAKEDRDIAEKLLESAGWIAINNDPLQEADRLSEIADKIVGRIGHESKHGNLRETERCYQRYEQVWNRCVSPSIARAGKKGWEPEKKKGFERQMQRHDQYQREQFQSMTEHAPPPLKQFFDSMNKKGRPGFPGHGHAPQFNSFKK